MDLLLLSMLVYTVLWIRVKVHFTIFSKLMSDYVV